MLSYALIYKLTADTTYEGDAFPSGGLSRWVLTARAPRLVGVTSMTVVIEAAESWEAPTWVTVHEFTLTTEDPTTVYTWAGPHGAKTSSGDAGSWLRATVTDVQGGGSYVLDVTARGILLDPQDEADLALLPPEVRNWSELPRVVQEAEVAIRGHLGGIKDIVGHLNATTWDPDFEETMRVALARQVVYLAGREKAPLEERLKYLERVIAPDVEKMLDPALDESVGIWRGR